MSLGKVLWDGGAEKSHEQSMQVSMGWQPWHCHTDRVSGDTTPYLPSQMKGRSWGSTSTQHSWMMLKADCMFTHSWQAKHISPAKPVWEPTKQDWRDHWPALAQLKLCLNYINHIKFNMYMYLLFPLMCEKKEQYSAAQLYVLQHWSHWTWVLNM